MKNTKKKSPVEIKKTRFEELTESQPDIPDYTCSSIDEAKNIVDEKLEVLRASNTGLRDGVEYWTGICQELLNEIDDLTKETKSLRRQIKLGSDSVVKKSRGKK